MKKTFLLLMALIISAGLAFSATTIPASSSVPGVHVLSQADGDPYSGANIIMGTDFSVWPWTSGPKAAFTPVKGGAYTMTFSFEATGDMNGLRVRWITDDSYGTNQADPLVEGMFGEGEGGPGRFTVSAADGTVAEGLSAYFTTGGIAKGSVLTYTVNFTMDDVEAFHNIGSIGIRGGSGSHAFVMNTIVIKDSKGNMLVNYDKDAKVVLPPSNNVPGVHVLSQADGDPYSGANIITGTDFSVWPWTSGPEAAFTPVKDGAYTMTFSFEATGDMNGLRVRWITDDSYGTNQADPLVEGMFGEGEGGPGRFTVSAEDGTVAEGLSAYFTTGGITKGSVLTYTVNFTMDDVEAFHNIGSIGIRGGSGSHAFIMNTIVIKDAKGNMLVNYDKDAKVVLPPSNNVPGVHVLSQADGDPYSGANIFTGTDFSVWPWTSGPEAAFTPVKDGAYKLTFSFEATGDMNGVRVRWITDDSYGTNQADPLVEGMFGEGEGGPGRFTVSAEDGTVAEGLSAYFTTGGITKGSVLTYTVNFTMDDVEAFHNIGSIGIRGGSGSHAFVMNTIVITDAAGNMLVNYDKDSETGIIEIKPKLLSNAYGIDGGIIVNADNEKVSVYSIYGRLEKQTFAGNNTIIPLQRGIYIVKVGTANPVKVIVR